MSETPKTKQTIELRHSDAAEEWALSEDRAVVFTVTKTIPNPRAGELIPLPPMLEDVPEGWVDERIPEAQPETIEARTDYTMPAKPNAGLALMYLKKARENADMAMSWLIETAIGEEGYDALAAELAGVEPAEAMATLRDVGAKIQKVAMGGLEAPKA